MLIDFLFGCSKKATTFVGCSSSSSSLERTVDGYGLKATIIVNLFFKVTNLFVLMVRNCLIFW